MNKNRDISMARFLAGEMNAKEEIAFRNKMEGNPEKSNDLSNMEKTWKYFDAFPSKPGDRTKKAWDNLYKKLEEDGLLELQANDSGTRNLLPALKAAAAILLILAIGIPALYFGVIRNSDQEVVLNHYSEKGISTINLPDGSRVYLNEGAEISYPPAFNQERSVQLNGEAFFEVMSDPVNPFTVRSDKVVISVLGTSFNVKRSMQSPELEVYVETGKVRMSMENSGKFITLEPGQLGLTKRQELIRADQKDPNYISWKTKDFKFVEAELMDVLQELEESYHVKIHPDQVDLADKKITTSYSGQSIDAILETIGTAFGLTVNLREDGFYLTN